MLAFVKDRKGNESGELGLKNSAWNDLEREWPGKGFTTARTATALGYKYYGLRRKAGKPMVGAHWSDAEEKALLAFVKNRKGDEFASLGPKNIVWEDLERKWKEEGFATTRTAYALGQKHMKLRRKRAAKNPTTTPQPSTMTSPSSTTAAPTSSVRSSGLKRTLAAASLSVFPSSTSAKKAKASPSPPTSVTPSLPPITVPVKTEAPDSDVDDRSDTHDGELWHVKVEIKAEHGGLPGW